MNYYGFTGGYDFPIIGRIAFTKMLIKWEKMPKGKGWRRKIGVGNIFEGKNLTKNYQKNIKNINILSNLEKILLHNLLIKFNLQYFLYIKYAKNCGQLLSFSSE